MTGKNPPPAPEPFGIELQPRRETIVVAARGEVDVVSAEQLRRQLREVLETGFRRIVLDLRHVSFMDSTGLHTVLDAAGASRRRDVDFALIHGPAAVRRLFEVTGTGPVLSFVDPEEVDRPGQGPGARARNRRSVG